MVKNPHTIADYLAQTPKERGVRTVKVKGIKYWTEHGSNYLVPEHPFYQRRKFPYFGLAGSIPKSAKLRKGKSIRKAEEWDSGFLGSLNKPIKRGRRL